MKSGLSVMRMTLAVCAGAIMVVAGCVNQNKEVQRYRREVDLNGATTRPTTLPSAWPSGKVLTLREAMYLTNQQNERLSLEGENYLQALITRQRDVGFFLPTSAITGAGFLGENVGVPNTPNHTFDATWNGNINLFNGFRDYNRLKAAGMTVEQRRQLLLDVQESLLSQAVLSYFVVLRAEARIHVLENSVAVQQTRVNYITAQQQVGLVRVLEVAQSQAQLSATRVQLIDAQSNAASARRALALLTNAQVGDAVLEDTPELPIGGEPDLPLLKQLALSQRQDLLAAQWARDAARRNVEVQIGQYYPSANLNLRYFLYRETQPEDRAWDSVLVLNLPVFSAGQIEADVRQAWSQFRQASLSEQQLRRQIESGVEQAYDDYMYSVQRYGELETQVRAARLAADQAEGTYKAGLATNLEWLTAQDQYLSAQLQLTSELYNFRGYAANLLRVIGGLRGWWENPAVLPAVIRSPAPATAPAATQPAAS